MTPRRLLLAAPAALAAAAAGLLLPLGGPASAAPAAAGPIPPGCGALDVTDTQAVAANAEGASDVFVGRVVRLDRVRVHPGATSGTTTSPATRDLLYDVLVDVPVTGDLAADRRVDVVLVGVEGGEEPLRRSRRYLFFATDEGSVLRADGCDGYASGTSLDAATLEEIRTALTAEPETPDAVLSKPEGSDGPPDLGRVVAPGAAVSLIGILGLVLISRVGRHRG
ncbi:hypothetical protein CFH99_23210 [Nocardioides aromaticivorans]|uniref:Uncharacterized protein n=1 Tax=Nocardioides aromaticivorans TaxID=200618 RepID=A0ABX7PRA5_9ACTN|nr:hypothetical protein [Nocardioides aromaticivorans]QSR28536.1 hypothetical protein CFH99_23210 [Nocardioides aromaticivorans]